MKTKGRFIIKLKLICAAALASAAVLAVLRFIQVRTLIDAETGFFTGHSPLNVVFYVLLAASALCFIVLSYLSKDAGEFRPNGGISSGRIFTLLAVPAFLFDAVSAALDKITPEQAAYMRSAVTILKIGSFARVLFALLSAAYFVILFIDEARGGERACRRRALALAPSVWAAFRLITLFTAKISYVRISDLLLQIVMLAFFCLFFISFAPQKSSIYSEGTTWKLFAYGTTAAVVALVVMLNRLIFSFIDGGVHLLSDYPFCAADLAAALFIFGFLFGKKRFPAEADVTVGEEAENQTIEQTEA